MVWLQEYCGDSFDDACPEPHWYAHYLRAMRLLLCSPDDADSIWFWQYLEVPINPWKIVCSKKAIKDMVARYIPLNHGGKTPLQLVAVAARFSVPMRSTQRWPFGIRWLKRIIAAIITTGAGLHEGDQHHTPLLLFLTSILAQIYWDDSGHPFQSRPRVLKRGLQHNGVDLVAYGAEERRQFLAYRCLEDPVPPLIYWYFLNGPFISLEVYHFSFSYGPTPEDWTIQLDYMINQYVGDFWKMPGLLDENVRAVPGAWVDDSSA